ncbi:hypothetical protein N7466_010609 [Penicillium verhagenii]|uniref:uncharacterized protein n=1 Tax=Penicillium verhagenii TaxID=1562060 RepID=UPI0025450211|nr:uncharacterized protein N7466_010609 [Penicillium verhagenii]KAJ5918617.1 hypothetical protein N7466_010609 [Penicillium verhagenii]
MSSYSTATTIPAETDGSTITSFLPLATVYTFPGSCSTKYRLDRPSLMAFDPAYGIDVQTGVDCGPAAVTTWWNSPDVTNGGYKTVVSIGPVKCPSDWSTVASSTKDSTSTALMCCPFDYYLDGAIAGQLEGNCLSNVSSGMTLTYGSTSDDSDSFTIATTTMSSSSTVGAIAIVGWNVQYVVSATASVTSSSIATSASTSTSTSISTSTATAATTATSAATSTSTASTTSTGSSTTHSTSTNTSAISDSTTSGGLSVGAKWGIGMGVGVGGIGVVALIAALWIFSRRWKAPQGRRVSELPGPTRQQYVPGAWQGNLAVPGEMDGASYVYGRKSQPPIELS